MSYLILLAAFLIPSQTAATTTDVKKEEIVKEEILSVQELVEREFGKGHIMNEVARCESHWTQFNASGQVLRGLVNHQDVGTFQENEYYHLAESQSLNMNIYTTKGNIAFARYLYDHEGLSPWLASKSCWSKVS